MSEAGLDSRRGESLGLASRSEVLPADTFPTVALFTNCIAPYYVSLFRRLRDRLGGLQIFVSTPKEPSLHGAAQLNDLPVTVQRCWTYPTERSHEQGFSDLVWRHFPYDTLPILLHERPGLVISGQLGIRTLQAAAYRRLIPKSRLVIWTALSEHTEKGFSAPRVLLRKALLRQADAVVVHGASGMNYLLKLGVPREKVIRFPYCAEIAPQLELPLERDASAAWRLLYVGQLIPRKGLIPFLAALTSWIEARPGTECEFWIAGDGPLRGELERFPVKPQLRLRFLGAIAYEKLSELYAQGGILVFPTLADEWGVVVNEALGAGLPVMGSLYSQAVEELVEDGVTGWTFHPDRPGEVQRALQQAFSTSGDGLAAMREQCRERVKGLTPAYFAERIVEAIRIASR